MKFAIAPFRSRSGQSLTVQIRSSAVWRPTTAEKSSRITHSYLPNLPIHPHLRQEHLTQVCISNPLGLG